jgi:hypothetical protein
MYQGALVVMQRHGLKHLQFPNMAASGGPPDGARVVHQRSYELLVQQNYIADGQTTSLGWKGSST